jgi:ABC-2 type transport system ATP-binding protein
MSEAIIKIEGLRKAYAGGVEALKGVDLDIRQGEILALLGPNGAGKTTLISIVCGIVTPSGGTVTVGGHDNQSDYRAARMLLPAPCTAAVSTFSKTLMCENGLGIW